MSHLALWQIHNGHARTSELRGRAVYEQAQTLGANIYIGDGGSEERAPYMPGGRLQVQIINPSNLGIIEMIHDIQDSTEFDGTVVVDVTFPIDDLSAMRGGLNPDDPLYEHDNETTRAAWGEDSASRAALYAAIRAAHAVITPHAPWAVPLRAMHERVYVVPDLHNHHGVSRFALQLAIAHAGRQR